MVNEIDENIDDAGRIQFLASRWRGELLPLGPLLGGWFLFGAEVDIGVLEGFPSQFVGVHQETQGVVYAQMQQVLEFLMSLASG